MKVLHINHSGDSKPRILEVTNIDVESQVVNDGSSYGYLTLFFEDGFELATHIWPVESAPEKYKEGENLEGVVLVAMCPDNF